MFSTTYFANLKELGFDHIAELLSSVRLKRNQFMHGQPEAIDDSLVKDLVFYIKDEHESWIAVFNKRATKKFK